MKVHIYASDGRTNAMIECETAGEWIAMDKDGQAKMASFQPTDVHEVQVLRGSESMRRFLVATTHRHYSSNWASDRPVDARAVDAIREEFLTGPLLYVGAMDRLAGVGLSKEDADRLVKEWIRTGEDPAVWIKSMEPEGGAGMSATITKKPEAAPKVEYLGCNEGYTFHRDPNLSPRTMKVLDDDGNTIAMIFGVRSIHLGPLPR